MRIFARAGLLTTRRNLQTPVFMPGTLGFRNRLFSRIGGDGRKMYCTPISLVEELKLLNRLGLHWMARFYLTDSGGFKYLAC